MIHLDTDLLGGLAQRIGGIQRILGVISHLLRLCHDGTDFFVERIHGLTAHVDAGVEVAGNLRALFSCGSDRLTILFALAQHLLALSGRKGEDDGQRCVNDKLDEDAGSGGGGTVHISGVNKHCHYACGEIDDTIGNNDLGFEVQRCKTEDKERRDKAARISALNDRSQKRCKADADDDDAALPDLIEFCKAQAGDQQGGANEDTDCYDRLHGNPVLPDRKERENSGTYPGGINCNSMSGAYVFQLHSITTFHIL